MFNQEGSRRWMHFQSALQLAVQRSAHKWTYEDFTECFPLYAEEDKNGASTTFNAISDYVETQSLRDLEKIFAKYNVRENIDVLHDIVTEAKERKKAKIASGNDAWKEELEPRNAVCARTVPVLEEEAKRLRESLAALEASNSEKESEIQANVEAMNEADARSLRLFKQLHEAVEEWQSLPSYDNEAWTISTADSTQSARQG